MKAAASLTTKPKTNSANYWKKEVPIATVAQWFQLGAPVENPAGQYQFTRPAATNSTRRF